MKTKEEQIEELSKRCYEAPAEHPYIRLEDEEITIDGYMCVDFLKELIKIVEG